jgi:hypothetical protein
MQLDVLREAVLDRLEGDSGFKSIAGWTAEDNRLYERYQAHPVSTDTQPVFITYMLLPVGESRMGVSEPTFSFIIWGKPKYYESLSSCRDRISALFDRQKWTAGSMSVWSRLVHEGDMDQPDTGLMGRSVQVRVGALDLPS